MQFAFDSDHTNPYLPQNVRKNSIYYLGNHDSNTFIGFLKSLSKDKLNAVKSQLNTNAKSLTEIHFDAIKKMFDSKADMVILQIQDVLLQDEKSRMNYPGRPFGCWEYKMPKNYKNKFTKNIKRIETYI